MNQYAQLPPDELDELLSNFLIPHWSISGVNSFCRNEKDFERQYIFCEYDKTDSVSSIIGTTYHYALMFFFQNLKDTGKELSFDHLTTIAHGKLAEYKAPNYRPQKSMTLLEQQEHALKSVNTLLQNFLHEKDCYIDDIKEIVAVEVGVKEFVTLAGIDIPLPMKGKFDLVFINHQDELCIADHKAKRNYTDEKDIKKNCSKQGVGYSCLIESCILAKHPDFHKLKGPVKNFYYYENKYSKNKDGGRQIRRIALDLNEGRDFYETMLSEAVMKMVQAVQDPDYIYLLNQDDFFVDSEAIIEFWIKTHLQGLDAFTNLPEKTRELLKLRKAQVHQARLSNIPKSVIESFQKDKAFITLSIQEMEKLPITERIEHRLRCFGFVTNVAHTIDGYSCDTLLLEVGAGTKIKDIFKFRLDIAAAVGADDIRISQNLIKYEDQSFIAIEINKMDRKILHLQESDLQKGSWKLPIGKDNFQNTIYWDLDNPSTPHMLGGGASGSGKSVTIRTMIKALQEIQGDNVEITILDPKFEFDPMRDKGCTVIQDIEEIEIFMLYLVDEMNERFQTKNFGKRRVIFFDEVNDALMQGTKALREANIKLVQKARSAGFHFAEFAQRLTSKAIDGNAKVNFPVRLCLTMPSAVDSKVILDEGGAENLNGKGDALIKSPELSQAVRIQCFSS